MSSLKSFSKGNELIICIAGGLALALVLPGPGRLLSGLGMVKPLLVAIFLCQGLNYRPSADLQGNKLGPLFLWGLMISQGLGPLVGMAAVKLLPLTADYEVGFIIMCAMAPTLVSGAVLAERAGGDGGAALLLTVGLNLIAVFTVPLNLKWTLGAGVELDAGALLFKLVALVLAPAMAGYFLARSRPAWAAASAQASRKIPTYALAIIVYMSFSLQTRRLSSLPLGDLFILAVVSLMVHGALLALAYGISRRPLNLGIPASRSLALVCSQKTLPIAVAVWSLTLAQTHPLAVLAPLVFHPTQILADSLLANYWGAQNRS